MKGKNLSLWIGIALGFIGLLGSGVSLTSYLDSPNQQIAALRSDFENHIKECDTYKVTHEREHRDRKEYVNKLIELLSNKVDKLIEDFKEFVKTQNKRHEEIIILIMQL